MSIPAILWSLVGAGLVLLIPAAMSTRL